jgi:hypothetical protein
MTEGTRYTRVNQFFPEPAAPLLPYEEDANSAMAHAVDFILRKRKEEKRK